MLPKNVTKISLTIYSIDRPASTAKRAKNELKNHALNKIIQPIYIFVLFLCLFHLK